MRHFKQVLVTFYNKKNRHTCISSLSFTLCGVISSSYSYSCLSKSCYLVVSKLLLNIPINKSPFSHPLSLPPPSPPPPSPPPPPQKKKNKGKKRKKLCLPKKSIINYLELNLWMNPWASSKSFFERELTIK